LGFEMKKLALALATLAAFTGSAVAADLPPGPAYSKAPAVVATPSWTGFYIFGGAGGGVWDANTGVSVTGGGPCIACITNRQGGDGWFGTAGAGYDWQVSQRWVFGILADGQFGSLKGSISDATLGAVGNEKLKDTWAVGARVGYLVAPNVFSYVNAGYTGSDWSGTTLVSAFTGAPSGFHTGGFNTQGWFVGGGVENNLDIFGIRAPGWFMKTEYRAAYYDNKNINELVDGSNALAGFDINFKPLVQTVSTSLVYRFNWNGPAVPNY
jgi:outer membrane immunogenic protein